MPDDAAWRWVSGLLLGIAIGAVAALLGVAGGELLIPTLIFLFGVDIYVAGTASVLVSLVMVPFALWRYVRLGMLRDGRGIATIAIPMGGGSMIGAVAGGLAVELVAPWLCKLILGVVLIISSIRVFARRD